MSQTDGPALSIKAFAFDVFGTIVDWRGSIAREAAALAGRLGIGGDWGKFADAWRAGYRPAMDRVRRGELPWTHIDNLHRMILDQIRGEFGLGSVGDSDLDHLNRAWHRLAPWPDAVEGLTRLKRHYIITTLSNGNFSLLIDLAKHGGLPWDCVISADLFNHYKPDPETYQGTARLLNIAQHELMLVASHPDDLRAARALGTRTAYVKRPLEHGPGAPVPEYTSGEFDLVAEDFIDLARRSS